MSSTTVQDTRGRGGVVVIGRNEGERLRRCMASVVALRSLLVYVDSGSTDDSIDLAQAHGAHVVRLDLSRPFTAARARNAGFARLRELAPDADWVQFVDGDCEIVPDWLERANTFLSSNDRVAAVSGRLRERHPERSIYNRLCDAEWDTPVGEARACGGIVMVRVAAFAQVGGFREQLIAGEEPELCVRLRAAGWRIWRLDAEMGLHDAEMTRFSQWWRRTRRAGFAFAEGAMLHGSPPERHWVRESRSAIVWGAVLPLLVIVGAAAIGTQALVVLLLYPVQIARVALRSRGPWPDRLSRAAFIVGGKFAEAAGAVQFWATWAGLRRAALIEHK